MPWTRRKLARLVIGTALAAVAGHQAWRHGAEYVFAENFRAVEPGRIFRGAWPKPWPLRRLIRDHQIKTIIALAHPPDHPLAVREKAIADKLGVRWIHLPIVDERTTLDGRSLQASLDAAADAIADPANQPVFFHCHHGLNRASMAQMAYRIRHEGWTLAEAAAEVDRTFGVANSKRGPDFRFMADYAKAYQRSRLGAASGSRARQ